MDYLKIKGARQHNLKNISIDLPKNRLVVFTGLSGSGKSSLAFDTIYAEGQRRYVESLSSYARQFLGIMDKPDVDSIEGLSPAISIDQKSTSHNPRSTVGTVTEIYDYLRLLFARIGHPHCPNCGREIQRQSSQQIITSILSLAKTEVEKSENGIFRFFILAPVVRDRKGEFSGLFDNLRSHGFREVRVDGQVMGIHDDIFLIKTNKHSIDAIVDRITIDRKSAKSIDAELSIPNTTKDKNKPDTNESSKEESIRRRIADAVEQAIGLSEGLVVIGAVSDSSFTFPSKPKHVIDHLFSERFACPVCNISIQEIEPRSFSFNSPHGACTTCSGIGTILTVDESLVLNKSLSISEGGILPFAKMLFHDTWFSRTFAAVAKTHGIDTRAPLRSLTKKQIDILLQGTGDRVYSVTGENRFGSITKIEETFTGVVAELKRRYTESDSEFVRGEIEKYMREEICPECTGKRLKKEALTVTVDNFSIADVTELSITDLASWITAIKKTLVNQTETQVGTPILKEIGARVQFLQDVGLEYLSLSRGAMSLSGGEAQRIRLASQIGSGLSGVLYVLDEPSIGLHQRDNSKLIRTLHLLRELGNTVIVVEHDREMMEASDFLVDFGPGAGEHGGNIVSSGTVQEVTHDPTSITGVYLRDERTISHPHTKKTDERDQFLTLVGASQNNLKDVTASFPLGKLTCVTGVSGSGKSTLIVETLYAALAKVFNPYSKTKPGTYEKLTGVEHIDKMILIDQSPIGRTPRSNPATYTGIFTVIRDLFAQLPESKLRGYSTGRFSFNVKGGRCEACEGEGQRKIEMQFLSDVYVTCEVCQGKRYNAETLEVLYHGKNIAEVLNMTAEEAKAFFAHFPSLAHKIETICDVGLGYIHLGQPATTLSGGEAQRVKLSSELGKRASGKTIYILDEPTTGLHFADLEKLLAVLHELTARGNTIIVIEHNLDIIKNADHIIDLGPEGGDKGGRIIATGTPHEIASVKNSYTGQYLKHVLNHK